MAPPRIDRKLNLVYEIEGAENYKFYVHSMPISRQVFTQYFKVISRTFAQFFNNNLGFSAGPRVAALMLQEEAEALGTWEGPGGVKDGLMAEIRRLTNVVLPGKSKGWETLPYEVARSREMLTEDEQMEVEGIICFFIVNSAMHKSETLRGILWGMNGLWGTQTSFSNVTEFTASLPPLTTDATLEPPLRQRPVSLPS